MLPLASLQELDTNEKQDQHHDPENNGCCADLARCRFEEGTSLRSSICINSALSFG
jgi:hypothetical protein